VQLLDDFKILSTPIFLFHSCPQCSLALKLCVIPATTCSCHAPIASDYILVTKIEIAHELLDAFYTLQGSTPDSVLTQHAYPCLREQVCSHLEPPVVLHNI